MNPVFTKFNPALLPGWRVLVLLTLLLAAGDGVAANFVVRMQGTRFVPRDITITVGDSITWTNLDFAGHDSVSGTNGVASGFWRTPLFGFGGSATVVFTNIAPRSYGYYCTPHVFVGMVGSVTVLPANTPPVVDILDPTNGAVVAAGAPLTVLADALDADGRVVRVDFSVDGAFLSSDNLGPFTATLNNPTPGDHILRAVAVDDRGAASAPVSVTITALLPPTLVETPLSVRTNLGSSVTFSAVAQGDSPLSYQWQFNDVDIPNATNTSYQLDSVAPTNQGNYTVTVSNAVGFVKSPPATLSLSEPPTITQILSPAADAKFPVGANVVVRVEVGNGDGVVERVDFYLDEELKATATNSPWEGTITNLAAGDPSIRVIAVDDLGASSEQSNRTIHVFSAPLVSITQPTNGAAFALSQPITFAANIVTRLVVTNLEFVAGALSLGEVIPDPTNSGSVMFHWQAVVLGSYLIQATATDELGQRGTSAPVNVRIYDATDVNEPFVTVSTSLPNFGRTGKTNIVWLTGTAGDDQGLSHVELFLMNQFTGGTNLLLGTTNWFSLGDLSPGAQNIDWRTSIALLPGQNTIQVRSVDLATNISPVLTRYFTYVVQITNLTVKIEPADDAAGIVSPDLTGKPLEIGKTYRMTAKPMRGWVFDQWQGAFAQGQTLQFVMKPDLKELTAKFIASPFHDEAGPYAGLILETNTFAATGNGFVTLQLTESGAFTGRLRVAGVNHSFRGALDFYEARGSAIVLRPSLTPIVLQLTNESGTITGAATDGSWTASVLCYRNPYATGTNPCPEAGNRTFLWRETAQSPSVAGSGINVSRRGQAVVTVAFSSGRTARMTSSISTAGSVPISFSASGQDTLLGWAVLDQAGNPSVSGDGYLIPVGTNGMATPLILQGLP